MIGYGLRTRKEAQDMSIRSEKLDLRLTPAAKQMLYSAAAATQRSVSEFVLESALARAEETLSDRRHFGLSAEKWEAFLKALDAPTRSHTRIERLLREPSAFESAAAVHRPKGRHDRSQSREANAQSRR